MKLILLTVLSLVCFGVISSQYDDEEIVDYTRIRKDDCPKGAPFCDENAEDELRIKKEKENEEKKKGKKKIAFKGKQPINGNLCNPQC
ncbi:hypothetical protein EWB00_008025 [Schistosoma japonicum]|uniref:Uncharacterized protein n=1 Tax=Schistosoma japonicum TaxID=6182 RepID=A0A4Z2CRY7_SCHJA|nr:hypothetical protein EWB00_008025 [Schistosoma japonicum]